MANPFKTLMQTLAINHRVDPLLIEAMTRVESGNRPWAFRYESHAGKYLVAAEDTAKLCGISVDSERTTDRALRAGARSHIRHL
jgi:hypothetical protein